MAMQGEENDVKRVLNFASDLGVRLIRNGAEMYRVEESVARVVEAYGFGDADVFAIPSYLSLNIRVNGENHNRSIRVHSGALNLKRLELLNELSRMVCHGELDIERAESELYRRAHFPNYPTWINYVAYGSGAFFFTLFWGGTAWDAAVAFVAGMLVRWAVGIAQKLKVNIFFDNVFASVVLALLPLAAAYLFPGLFHLDMMIMGALMLLVPGVAIANVMRDALAGDTLTAITRFTEVLLIGVGIAIGIAMPLALFRLLFGTI